MRVPFRIVDVFAERPLAGNQLCVVPDGAGLDGDTMQALAREIGFSESTFVLSAAGDRYEMRVFTPGAEMPFAGHPTLGTAYLLASEGRIGTHATQTVPAGEFEVDVDLEGGRASVRQHTPRFGPTLPHDRVAAAVGLATDDLDPSVEPQGVYTGLQHVLVLASSPDAVARAWPDPVAVQDLVDETGSDALYLFAVEGPGEVKARLFAPGVGIVEDPATGSAAGPTGAYLTKHGLAGMPGHLRIRQGEEIARPSVLEADVSVDGDDWEVVVSGGVFVVGRGEFTI